MDASQLLTSSLSHLQSERESATLQLEHFQQSNPNQYLLSLSLTLADPNAQPHIRNAAGLAIKNSLSARESNRQDEYASRWRSLEDSTRDQLRRDALATLAADQKLPRNVAGQVIAAVAALDLPAGQWGNLIAQLLERAGHPDNPGMRQATLQAIGYICESIVRVFSFRFTPPIDSSPIRNRFAFIPRTDLCSFPPCQKPEVLATQSNEILTAVVQGARKEEPRFVYSYLLFGSPPMLILVCSPSSSHTSPVSKFSLQLSTLCTTLLSSSRKIFRGRLVFYLQYSLSCY